MKQRTVNWTFLIGIILVVAVSLFYIITSKPEHRPAPAAPQKISGPTLPA